MALVFSVLLISLLLQVSICMRNFHFPHPHIYGLGMYNHYPHYEDYDSESLVVRSHRNRYHRFKDNSDYSDSEHHYKMACRCSCVKCRKPKPKPCCKDFCLQQCSMQNNIFVVPYPVPFVVSPLNQSATRATTTEQATTHTSTTPLTISTTTLTTTTTAETKSTAVFFVRNQPKRFRIVADKRRRNMGNNDIRPPKFRDRLPKYGIVPIPEKLAIRLMEQMRDGHRKNQYRRQVNVDRNVLQNY
ncbi:uncharacterized protein LOC118269406 [Spodoptera frugiperda]|uniref:Uncharacterized protein LOC118269406 n=1 Tax=Spodoptera frugiperda TaxID=7108 RepID=A0A9R0EKC1_SPOFR|nr:uncharacterized protein LOC118269406 [Spodoptera frugiperda]